jgi:DNA-binding transcriptional MerR regulator
VHYLKVREAAQRLHVSPSTLRAWEHRFGFPKPERSPGGHRLYRHVDIVALRDALEQGLSVAAAIARVRVGETYDASSLVLQLSSFDPERAARVAEGALAMRSLEGAVEEVLLPALAEIERRNGGDSVEWAFAARWISDWLRWTQRLAMPGQQRVRLLVVDATRHALDADSVLLDALALFCVRAGGELVTVPLTARRGLEEMVGRLRPAATVVVGQGGSDDEVVELAAAARAYDARPLAFYRRRLTERTPGVAMLVDTPLEAQRQLLRLAAGEPIGKPRPRFDATLPRAVSQ